MKTSRKKYERDEYQQPLAWSLSLAKQSHRMADFLKAVIVKSVYFEGEGKGEFTYKLVVKNTSKVKY